MCYYRHLPEGQDAIGIWRRISAPNRFCNFHLQSIYASNLRGLHVLIHKGLVRLQQLPFIQYVMFPMRQMASEATYTTTSHLIQTLSTGNIYTSKLTLVTH